MSREEMIKAAILHRLRPACVMLVELPTQGIEAQDSAISVLHSLQQMILEQMPPFAVEACMEYLLFPLLLLVDSAVALRTKKQPAPKNPVIVTDKLAEGVTTCLECLLQSCPVRDIELLKKLLRTLVGAAMLSPEQGSEEFRHGILKCLRAMFEKLVRCQDTECCCRAASPNLNSIGNSKLEQEKPLLLGDNCVLGYLQSEDMSASIGHLCSLLLQISHAEAAKAGLGSGAIRAYSISTLRLIMTKVGTADALGFFLPGIASGLGKTIKSALVAKKRSSTLNNVVQFYSVGAAGNSRSLQEAVRGIADLLVLVLADARNSKAVSVVASDLEAILSSLQAKVDGQLKVTEEKKIDARDRKVMRVERNEQWLNETVPHVKTLLVDVFPALSAHPSAAVRVAVAESSGAILAACRETLKPCMPSILETLLFLAVDDSKAVSDAATGCLAPSQSQKLEGALFELLNRLLEDLPKIMFTGDEVPALLHARRLTAAMYFSGPEAVYTLICQSPATISNFITIMRQSLSLPSALSSSFSKIGTESYMLTGAVEGSQVVSADQLPRRAPWFVQAGKVKLYDAFATILRLAGYSSLTGSSRQRLADMLAELQTDIRDCAANCVSLDTPFSSAGQLRRNAATAACILNELVYGASGMWIIRSFANAEHRALLHSKWSEYPPRRFPCIIENVRHVLQDYMVSELWDLPVDYGVGTVNADDTDANLAHSLQDNAALQQMLVEGVGTFGLILGDSFEKTGFLGLVIYPLLEKLGSSRYAVSHSAGISLNAISHHCGYDSVRKLVVANLDHVVDSLCRQLRHIMIYPQAPNLLTAILQQTGAAVDMLPLLEEPMRGLLLELEISGRHHHPHFTIPVLKALREITKAARQGSFDLADTDVQGRKEADIETLMQLRRCQSSVLTVATSCVLAAAPLLASKNLHVTITALDVIEEGMVALSKVQAAFKANNEKWRRALESQMSEDGTSFEPPDSDPNEGNKLLPTMHEVWPHLVNCLKQKHPAVVARCLHVIATSSEECGGDFLARRFKKDALPLFLRLLRDGPVDDTRKGIKQLVLASAATEELVSRESPSAILKVQEAALRCIKTISENSRSASALNAVFETIAASVVGLACCHSALTDLAADTAVGLSNIDADLVWILAADLAYGHAAATVAPEQPTGFPPCSEILPPLSSPKQALCFQYAEQEFKHSLDPGCALALLGKLEGSRGLA